MFTKREVTTAIIKILTKAAIVIVIAIVIVSIASRKIAQIGDDLVQKQTAYLILTKQSETTTTLQETFKKIGDGDKQIELALPSPENVVDFVGSLESIASQTSLPQTLKFGNIVTSPAADSAKTFSALDYTITLAGNSTTLISYLRQLERLPYFTGIADLAIASTTPLGWDSNSLITIQAKLYTQ